jgi:CHAT domain-containing protein/tetratricopeptide (TPR) repeat protein
MSKKERERRLEKLYDEIEQKLDATDYEGALPLLEEQIEHKRELFGDSSLEFAAALEEKADIYEELGLLDQAKGTLQWVLQIRADQRGPKHPDVLATQEHLDELLARNQPSQTALADIPINPNAEAQVAALSKQLENLREQGRHAEALSVAEMAVDFSRKMLGDNHYVFLICLNNLAGCHFRLNDYIRALPLIARATKLHGALAGTHNPEYVNFLTNLAATYWQIGDTKRAQHLFDRALTIQRLLYDKPALPAILQKMAGFYIGGADYARAIPLLEEACDISRSVSGTSHPDYAMTLNNLAFAYKESGCFDKAEPLCELAVNILTPTANEIHPGYPVCLTNLAQLYDQKGESSSAIMLFEKVLRIRATTSNGDRLDYAETLNNLAEVYRKAANRKQAEPLYREALALLECAGTPDRCTMTCLNNLALMHHECGEYEKAETYFQQTLAIGKRILGEQHPDIARTLESFAGVRQAQHRHLEAQTLLEKATEIYETSFGAQSSQYLKAVVLLANLHSATGDTERTELLLLKAQDSIVRMRSGRHPDHVFTLQQLGQAYWEIGDYERSRELYERSLTIASANWGKHHPLYASALIGLGLVRLTLDEYPAAQSLLEEARRVLNSANGALNMQYVGCLSLLAYLYQAMGQFRRAELFSKQALKLNRVVFGDNHPSSTRYARDVVTALMATDQKELAFEMLLAVQRTHEQHIVDFSWGATERQAQHFLDQVKAFSDTFLSVVGRFFSDNASHVGSAFNLVLRSKGLGAEIASRKLESVLGDADVKLKVEFEGLQALRRKLATLSLDGPDNACSNASTSLLEDLRERKERLERRLCQQLPVLQFEKQIGEVTGSIIAATLPEGSVLIEIVRAEMRDFKAVAAKGEDPWRSARYLAFILVAGKPSAIVLRDLGDAETIDELSKLFLVNITGDTTQDSYSFCGRLLRKIIFDPLINDFHGLNRLYISPDGDLNLLPFETLPLDDGSFLSERLEISYLNSGRHLLRSSRSPRLDLGPSLVVANPEFLLRCDKNQLSEVSCRDKPTRGLGARDLINSQIRFEPLPGAQREGASVSIRIGTHQFWTGAEALESRIKTIRSPQILHIATHGFFLPNREKELNEVSHLSIGKARRLHGPGMENPMLRSGLALAGAQTYLENGFLPAEAEDGLLTAEDVSGMDLRGTELVVLSACDTGRGEAKVGQGVFGLRRAFEIAGARTMITSLWKASDGATCELMIAFYDGLKNGKTKLSAFRSAQEKLRRKYHHPYYWGAFILIGDGGELRLQ